MFLAIGVVAPDPQVVDEPVVAGPDVQRVADEPNELPDGPAGRTSTAPSDPMGDRPPPATPSDASEDVPGGPATPDPGGDVATAGGERVDVARVVDGDTVELDDGRRVRLAIVDTPEVHSGYERCGAEASDFTSRFTGGSALLLRRPDDAPRTDGFGRTLGELVRLRDGISLNVALVRNGFGELDERFVEEDPDLARRLRDAMAAADRPRCAGRPAPDPALRPTQTPAAVETAPAPQPLAEAEPEPEPAGGCHSDYLPCLPVVGDLNCGDVGVVVEVVDTSDPYGLDGDSDGVGCESYG